MATRIVLDTKGIGEFLRNDGMEIIEEQSNIVMARLGDGYEAKPFIGFDRAVINIHASTDEARLDNLENNTLLRAINYGN